MPDGKADALSLADIFNRTSARDGALHWNYSATRKS